MSTFCLFHNKLLSAWRHKPLNTLPCLIRNTFHTRGWNSISPGLFCQMTLAGRRFLHYFFLCYARVFSGCDVAILRGRPWPRHTHNRHRLIVSWTRTRTLLCDMNNISIRSEILTQNRMLSSLSVFNPASKCKEMKLLSLAKKILNWQHERENK